VITKPRFALLAGAIFIVLALVYGTLSQDWAGVTMLFALGIAMAVMAYVLVVGSPRGDEQ
jgi:uncharacterized membrane protein YagU involved in acid resistance